MFCFLYFTHSLLDTEPWEMEDLGETQSRDRTVLMFAGLFFKKIFHFLQPQRWELKEPKDTAYNRICALITLGILNFYNWCCAVVPIACPAFWLDPRCLIRAALSTRSTETYLGPCFWTCETWRCPAEQRFRTVWCVSRTYSGGRSPPSGTQHQLLRLDWGCWKKNTVLNNVIMPSLSKNTIDTRIW